MQSSLDYVDQSSLVLLNYSEEHQKRMNTLIACDEHFNSMSMERIEPCQARRKKSWKEVNNSEWLSLDNVSCQEGEKKSYTMHHKLHAGFIPSLSSSSFGEGGLLVDTGIHMSSGWLLRVLEVKTVVETDCTPHPMISLLLSIEHADCIRLDDWSHVARKQAYIDRESSTNQIKHKKTEKEYERWVKEREREREGAE